MPHVAHRGGFSVKTKPNLGGYNLVQAEDYVDGGEVLIGKLVGTSLASIWLAFVGGWIGLITTVARVHIRMIRTIEGVYVSVITAFGEGGAETLRYGWSEAFRAAVDTSPLLAPAIMSLELIAVSWLLLWARRRWY